MSRRIYSHVHRYVKVNLAKKKTKSYIVFRCDLPGCSHYIPRELARGKTSICHICGNEFVMDSSSLLLTKPHCLTCKVGPEDLEKIKDILTGEL